jgi:hypothetical protein
VRALTAGAAPACRLPQDGGAGVARLESLTVLTQVKQLSLTLGCVEQARALAEVGAWPGVVVVVGGGCCYL